MKTKYKVAAIVACLAAGPLAASALAGGTVHNWYTTTTETCKTITQYVTTTLHDTTTVTVTTPVTTTVTTPSVTTTVTTPPVTTMQTATVEHTTTVTNNHTDTVTLPAQVTTVTLPAVTNTVTLPARTTTVVRNHTTIKRVVIKPKPLTPKQKCLAAKANGAKWNGHTCEFRGEG